MVGRASPFTCRAWTRSSWARLFFLFEAATAFAGELLDIDAFDQPGVEEGKRLAFGLLGRKGYEAQREAVLDSRSRQLRPLSCLTRRSRRVGSWH